MDEINFLKYSCTFLLLSAILFLLYQYLTRNYNYWQSRGIPCETPRLFVGNFWEVFSGRTQVGKFFGKLYSKYNTPYFGLYILDRPYLVLRNPQIIKRILIGDFNNFHDRIFACDKNADPMAGNSVFLLRNPRWRTVRTKLTSIFTSAKLKNMFPIMRDVGDTLEAYLGQFDGRIVDVKEISAKYMTDVTAMCFFGFETNSFEHEDNVFRRVGRRLFDFNVLRISFSIFAYFFLPRVVSLFKIKFADVESTDFLRKVFISTIAERERLQFKRNDFVDLLVSLKDVTNNNFDEDTMVSQALTFFLAGFESTSNVISFVLYELCVHPEAQRRARDEIHAYFRDKGDDNVTFEDLHNLKYLDMVLAETLRRYPFAPFLNRKCKEDYYVEETGFTIEKGTEILVPTDGLHFDPVYFPEPDRFIPERFGADVRFSSDVYLPFGAGPRFCIGDRFGIIATKVSLIYYLRNFTFEKCKQTPIPLVLNPRSPFVMSDEGLPMKITKIVS